MLTILRTRCACEPEAPTRHLADGGLVAEHEFAAPDHGGGIGHDERDQAAARACGAGLLDRLAAQETEAGLELAGEQQPGLGRVVVRGQLAAL